MTHTPERLPHHSKRQACGSCDPRPHQRSHHGLRNIYREYARRRSNAHGEGILTAKLNKKVVPYVTHPTSVFDKGQQSFVRKILNFVCKCVVPIISHWYSLDDSPVSDTPFPHIYHRWF